jgi:hypothetical protein
MILRVVKCIHTHFVIVSTADCPYKPNISFKKPCEVKLDFHPSKDASDSASIPMFPTKDSVF